MSNKNSNNTSNQDQVSEENQTPSLKPESIFPYTFRTSQKAIIEKLHSTITQGTQLAMESGTGTGKTISAIAPAIIAAINSKKRILYLTRTNSQQRQVILELREIAKRLPKNTLADDMILGIGLQGRSNLCPLFHSDPELATGTPEELSKLCSDKKRYRPADLERG
jgi:DNA excision repair protein ERCC-2